LWHVDRTRRLSGGGPRTKRARRSLASTHQGSVLSPSRAASASHHTASPAGDPSSGSSPPSRRRTLRRSFACSSRVTLLNRRSLDVRSYVAGASEDVSRRMRSRQGVRRFGNTRRCNVVMLVRSRCCSSTRSGSRGNPEQAAAHFTLRSSSRWRASMLASQALSSPTRNQSPCVIHPRPPDGLPSSPTTRERRNECRNERSWR
jgi:hypothetical protein